MGRPACAALAIGLLTIARPAVGRLLGADVRRYTLLFALSAALLTQGTSGAISSHGMQLLGTSRSPRRRRTDCPPPC